MLNMYKHDASHTNVAGAMRRRTNELAWTGLPYAVASGVGRQRNGARENKKPNIDIVSASVAHAERG